MAKSKFDFDSSFKLPPSKAPSFKSGSGQGNFIERLMYAQSKGMMDAQMKQQERGNIGQDIETVKQQFGGKVPPGTKLNVGGVSAPLNRELTEGESKSVAASRVYPQVKNKVQELIRGGVLNSKNGLFNTGSFPNADRTVRQISAQQKSPLTTAYDPDLQMLQSKMAKLKELMFERGGTALTPTEESILGSAFVLEGKSDEQILEDISLADTLVEEKAKLALGGANAAMSPIPGMNLQLGSQQNGGGVNVEQERQYAMEAIKRGAPEAKVRDRFRANTGQEL